MSPPAPRATGAGGATGSTATRARLLSAAQRRLSGVRVPSRAVGRAGSPRAQLALFAVAAVAFLAALVVSARNVPDLRDGLHLGYLAVVAGACVPAMVVFNAWEYQVSAALLDRRVPFRDTLAVSLASTAANLLPLPGSAVVRTEALRRLGTGAGAAVTSTLVMAAAWVATVGLFAGGLLVAASAVPVGAGLLVVGAGAAAAAFTGLWRWAPRHALARLTAAVAAVELGAVAVSAARLYLVLLAVGFPVDFRRAAALTVAGVVASATGVVPGGLGVRELVAGAVGPLVGIPASVSVFATAIGRLTEYAVLLPVSVALAIRFRGRTATARPR